MECISSFITKLNKEGNLFEGTEEIVNAVHSHMTEELTAHSNFDESDPANQKESEFLDLISELTLSDQQISELEKPIEEEEIEEPLL
mgnify:CR=1 FL=1